MPDIGPIAPRLHGRRCKSRLRTRDSPREGVREALRERRADGYRGAMALEVIAARPARGSSGTASGWPSTRARRWRCWPISRSPTRPRSREALCELLWPGHDPDHARGALRRTLSTLRTAVGEEWIDTAGDSVALQRGPGLELDVARFRALAGRRRLPPRA